jgi:hypothetical protein
MSRSRLDTCIARLVAQRDALAWAREVVGAVPGPILEVGLGNGRTYDHLRHLFPDRPIWAFDRALMAHPRCVPPDALLILGELRETLPGAAARIGEPACLVHADLGFGVPETDEATARFLDAWIFGLAAEGGLVLSDLALRRPQGFEEIRPPRVEPGRYHAYRRLPSSPA